MLSDIFYTAVDSAVAAAFLFVLARMMGKKQIAQLTYFDYIVGISIGSIAAGVSVDRRIPFIDGLVSMAVWSMFAILFAYISVRSMKTRRLLDGNPVVLVRDGKIIEKNLRKSKFTVNDLLEELRQKDVFNLTGIEFAILETSGRLSILKKDDSGNGQSICANVIIDGKLMRENMRQIGISEGWLLGELAKQSVFSPCDVLLATCDFNHTLHIDQKNADPADFSGFQ